MVRNKRLQQRWLTMAVVDLLHHVSIGGEFFNSIKNIETLGEVKSKFQLATMPLTALSFLFVC